MNYFPRDELYTLYRLVFLHIFESSAKYQKKLFEQVSETFYFILFIFPLFLCSKFVISIIYYHADCCQLFKCNISRILFHCCGGNFFEHRKTATFLFLVVYSYLLLSITREFTFTVYSITFFLSYKATSHLPVRPPIYLTNFSPALSYHFHFFSAGIVW